MSAEKTIQEEREDKQAVKLKSLLKQPESQEFDDAKKLEKALGIEVALQYLGKHLDATTSERLKKEPGAWKEAVAVGYFMKKAKETGNNELKDNLLQLLKNPDIKSKDIGLYAARGIEETLESENLEEILDEDTSKKTQFKSEKNTIDIMFLPISKTSKNNFYMYIETPRLKKNLKNLKVNIHAPGMMNEESKKNALQWASFYIEKEFSEEHKKLTKRLKIGGLFLSTIYSGAGITSGIILGILEANAAIPLFSSLTGLGLGAFTSGLMYFLCKPDLSQIERIKKAGKMLPDIDPQSVNWVRNNYLENVYYAACNGKYFSRHEADPLAHKARDLLLKNIKKGRLVIAPEFQINYTGRKKQTRAINKESGIKSRLM